MSGRITGLESYNTDASKHRDWRDNLNLGIFGTDTESAIKGRELENGKIEANFWDRVVGNSTEELTNAAQKRRAKSIERGIGGDLLAEDVDISINSSDNKINKQVRDFKDEKTAMQELELTGGYTGSISELKGQGASHIRSLIPQAKRTARTQNHESDPLVIQAKIDADRDRDYQRGRDKESDNRYKTELLRDERIRSENALTRSQERGDALELRRDNMNLEYARMARQDRNDMKDRKDKNIMMLMQGLAGIATGFTV